jgi:acetoin utilization deacetylase AcuC-like enzyme/GNAT superfamily N-acetyltransferase
LLRILKVTDAHAPSSLEAIAGAQEIIRAQFPGMPASDVDKLPALIEDPFKYGFVGQLLIAEDTEASLRAIAILLYAGDLKFAWLDMISTRLGDKRGGLGMALYERVREEAHALGARGLYFECLPDEPELSPDTATRKQNIARLRFYERYGARPVLGTAYETPEDPSDTDSPYLVFDGLGRFKLPRAKELKTIVRAILERKYGDLCSPEYIEGVAASVDNKTLRIRGPRYVKEPKAAPASRLNVKIPLVVNDKHDIHHIRERGYVEAPVRISAILKELDKTDLFERIEPKHFGERYVRETHDGALVDYIERACAETPLKKSIYPYVFPLRNPARKPRERSVLAGYWCIDTFTPINRNAYPAARRAVDCALTAAERVARGSPAAYALIRPPGHHAEYRAFGGFCYFCNAAVAAQYLSRRGRAAILDIDYHHGNGQQDIFYARDDVLTVSVHGDPSFAYPYFAGFKDEVGRGAGAGYNLNIPLPETITPEEHRKAVAKGLRRVARHKTEFLIVALGLDTAKGDPTGTWSNQAADFREMGRMIGEKGYRTLVIQEGGYRVRTLGINARNFFTGLTEGLAASLTAGTERKAVPKARARAIDPAALQWRSEVREADAMAIRQLVARTDMFTSEEVAIAAELVEERVMRGRISGYEFVVAEVPDDDGTRIVAYACYGPTPGTEGRYDLYWIAVDRDLQGKGSGREVHRRVEDAVRSQGGSRIYADTSGREQYAPTRRFYRETGYRKVAELPDFYREGDSKVIYMKELV